MPPKTIVKKTDKQDIGKVIEGKWEIAEQNIGNTEQFSTLYNIKHSEIMEFKLANRSSKQDNECQGRVSIGDDPLNNWSLNSDGTKIVIADDIFGISFSEDCNQMTLSKPKENIKIALKRW